MNDNSIRLIFSYVIATLILVGSYYALVIYPYVLDADVKLWLTSASGAAVLFIFGDQVAARSRANTKSDIMETPPNADIILLIVAFVCFVLEAVKVNPVPRVNLLAVGLAAWVLAALV